LEHHEQHVRYIVNGTAYDRWSDIPDALKSEPAPPNPESDHRPAPLIDW